jgi:hypothetical protein
MIKILEELSSTKFNVLHCQNRFELFFFQIFVFEQQTFIFQMKELSQELALLLWNSFGTIAVLLQVCCI